ncbi:hypothetical protein OROMI_010892 [Orobanche minor]
MKIIGSPRRSERSSHPGLGQGQGDGDVVKKLDNGICFCLCTGSPVNCMKFFLCHVSDNVTEEELRQQPLRKRSPPDADMNPFGSIQFGCGTSYVSVGSMVYCIGGQKGDANTGVERGNEVRKFDTEISNFEVDRMSPPMNEGRCFAAVVAIGKTIYVFGGLSPTATEDSLWAECLNTDMPIAMQKWMPLKQPPFRLELEISTFAIPYKNGSILIANEDISKGALLYNVCDGIWMKYEYPFMYSHVSRPVSVVCEKTVYWIDKFNMFAYDYETHVLYSGLLRELLYEKDFTCSTLKGPYLMHLKDDVFCCFITYVMYHHRDPTPTKVVQCTTFQVTKHSSGSARGDLRLHATSIKSYKCGTLFTLLGVVPMIKQGSACQIQKNEEMAQRKRNA